MNEIERLLAGEGKKFLNVDVLMRSRINGATARTLLENMTACGLCKSLCYGHGGIVCVQKPVDRIRFSLRNVVALDDRTIAGDPQQEKVQISECPIIIANEKTAKMATKLFEKDAGI